MFGWRRNHSLPLDVDSDGEIIRSRNHRLLKILACWPTKHPIHEVSNMDHRSSTRFVPYTSFARAGHNLKDILQQREMSRSTRAKPDSSLVGWPHLVREFSYSSDDTGEVISLIKLPFLLTYCLNYIAILIRFFLGLPYGVYHIYFVRLVQICKMNV